MSASEISNMAPSSEADGDGNWNNVSFLMATNLAESGVLLERSMPSWSGDIMPSNEELPRNDVVGDSGGGTVNGQPHSGHPAT
jgi:hypothetical protein